MVPKQNLPNYSEFYEARHFTPGPDAGTPTEMRTLRSHPEYAFPFGAKLLFSCVEMPDFTFGVEICEDVWVADTPVCHHGKIRCGADRKSVVQR